MHFIIGGAFNGKSQWVKNYYQNKKSVVIYDLSTRDKLFDVSEETAQIVILLSIQHLTKIWSDTNEADVVRQLGQNWLADCRRWENELPTREIALVGTDFSKGIVPMEKSMRLWRDVTGWFYQDITNEAEKVHQIWYGLSTKLK